jgi:hypothetical protein
MVGHFQVVLVGLVVVVLKTKQPQLVPELVDKEMLVVLVYHKMKLVLVVVVVEKVQLVEMHQMVI